jgi:hypothetical protein
MGHEWNLGTGQISYQSQNGPSQKSGQSKPLDAHALGFEQWANNRKVIEINLGANSGVKLEATSRFITKMGHGKIGENFVKSGSGRE